MSTNWARAAIMANFCFIMHAPAHNGGAAAFAFPLENITIDGKLDDWPEKMPTYPVLTNPRPYGPTDIDREDLRSCKDLSARFMVGYCPVSGVVYVGVVVQDDTNVADGRDHYSNDACEVYIEGGHRGHSTSNRFAVATALPALQFVGVPTGTSWWPAA